MWGSCFSLASRRSRHKKRQIRRLLQVGTERSWGCRGTAMVQIECVDLRRSGACVCVFVFSYPNNHPCGRKASSLMSFLMASTTQHIWTSGAGRRSYQPCYVAPWSYWEKRIAQKQQVVVSCGRPDSWKKELRCLKTNEKSLNEIEPQVIPFE